MKLYIAEKPSLGRAIADVLPKPLQKGEGFIKASNGDVVSWCIGHLLEQAEPDFYDPRFKKWQIEHLPIIPLKWQLKVKPKTKKPAYSRLFCLYLQLLTYTLNLLSHLVI